MLKLKQIDSSAASVGSVLVNTSSGLQWSGATTEKASVSGGTPIETVADVIWEFHQQPQPHPSADPVNYMTLAEYKNLRKEEVNAYRDTIINGGYTWNGHVYDSDEHACANVTSVSTAIANGIALPSNFTWRTKNNVNVQMTAQEIVAFGVSMMDWVSRVYTVSWFHKDNLDNPYFDNNIKIKNYNIALYWPTS